MTGASLFNTGAVEEIMAVATLDAVAGEGNAASRSSALSRAPEGPFCADPSAVLKSARALAKSASFS
jgi:hypothetical protein